MPFGDSHPRVVLRINCEKHDFGREEQPEAQPEGQQPAEPDPPAPEPVAQEPEAPSAPAEDEQPAEQEAEIPAPANLANRNIERPTTSYKHAHPTAGERGDGTADVNEGNDIKPKSSRRKKRKRREIELNQEPTQTKRVRIK